jgi:DNA polymerase-3 subunit gamma/tau
MDAASNTSVEYIRALREELAYSPIMCKKRVYIIDEVHMLSGGAFNAFLKTLEEPPEHALFILATTERHKVPATVASRCQRFAFRRIPGEVIAERLDMVCKGEGISIEPDALELIARIADGALRDALSLLEQCTAAGREFSVTEASVREALGLTGLNDLAAWLMEISDLPKSMARLNELYQGGMDVSAILGQLSALLRDLMMGQMTGDLSLTRLPEKEAEALSGEWPKARILSALEQFAQTRLSRSGDKKLEADLCLIRLANAGGEPPAARASVGADEADSRPQSPVVADDDRPQYKPAGGGRQIASPTGLRSLTDAAADPRWAKLLDSIDNLILKDALKDSGAKVDGDTLIIENSFVWGLVKQSQAEEQIMRFFPGGFWET